MSKKKKKETPLSPSIHLLNPIISILGEYSTVFWIFFPRLSPLLLPPNSYLQRAWKQFLFPRREMLLLCQNPPDISESHTGVLRHNDELPAAILHSDSRRSTIYKT